jgi:isochorismate pyruvate lyase
VKIPEECGCIEEIRCGIDTIDYQIMQLFSKRLEYVREIVKFKTDEESIIAAPRRDSVIEQRRKWAEEMGLPADLFSEMYSKLIQHCIAEEMEILKARNNKNKN